jgi:anthranilate synthase/aminodeoxychorismate synthase-like glutamine amidotransferase
MRKILLIDNYDSFTYNLYYLIQQNYPGEVEVIRNNAIRLEEVRNYEAIVISPGPGTPANSGLTMRVLADYYDKKPILGICLGMQCINEYFGGKTIKAPFPVHGKQSEVFIIDCGLVMNNLTQPIMVGRYHSLIISGISDDLLITAITSDKLPMVVEHSQLPIYGIQFHPESFLTEEGSIMIRNFLKLLEQR